MWVLTACSDFHWNFLFWLIGILWVMLFKFPIIFEFFELFSVVEYTLYSCSPFKHIETCFRANICTILENVPCRFWGEYVFCHCWLECSIYVNYIYSIDQYYDHSMINMVSISSIVLSIECKLLESLFFLNWISYVFLSSVGFCFKDFGIL